MPPATQKGGPDLDIVLDPIGRAYYPGDLITGRIIRRSHVVSPMAIIEVCLLGRAKVKLGVTRSNGQSAQTSYYRGRFNFFDDTQQTLHAGPIHVPQRGDPDVWEFALEIPLTLAPRAVLSEHSDPKSSYLPLGLNDIKSCPTPGSFFGNGRCRNKRFECYVEYHIEAKLSLQNSHAKSTIASLPVIVQAYPLAHPLESFNLKSQSHTGSISSHHLVPGMEDAGLTFKQKTQHLFHSSKVPYLGFVVQVDSPSIIQLGNPSPLPFSIRIVPDRKRTSEAVRDAPQTAVVTSLELILKSRTDIIAQGTLTSTIYEADDTDKYRIFFPLRALAARALAPASASASASAPKQVAPDGDVDAITPPAYEEKPPLIEEPDKKTDTVVVEENNTADLPPYSRTDPSCASSMTGSTDNSSARSVVEAPASTSTSTGHHHIPPSQCQGFPLDISWDLNTPPVDLGTLGDLHIYPTHATILGKNVLTNMPNDIYPSFMTYCIQHTHILKWKMILEIAGGKHAKFEGEHLVSILGPSAQ